MCYTPIEGWEAISLPGKRGDYILKITAHTEPFLISRFRFADLSRFFIYEHRLSFLLLTPLCFNIGFNIALIETPEIANFETA